MRFPGPTHLVALAREWTPELSAYIESKLEGKFQLEINREKTRVVDLRKEGAEVNFLGYTFHRDTDIFGRGKRYLNNALSTLAPAASGRGSV